MSWQDTKWGDWQRTSTGRLVRHGTVNGRIEYHLWDHLRGPVLDRAGDRVDDRLADALVALIPRTTDAHGEITAALGQLSLPNTSAQRPDSSTSDYPLSSTSNTTGRHAPPPQPPQSRVNSQPPGRTNPPARANPSQAGLIQGVIFPHPEQLTGSTAAPSHGGVPANPNQLPKPSNEAVTDNKGKTVPEVDERDPLATGAAKRDRRNGRTYYLDRHNQVIAVSKLNSSVSRSAAPPPNSTGAVQNLSIRKTAPKLSAQVSVVKNPQQKPTSQGKLPPISEQTALNKYPRGIRGHGHGEREEELDPRYTIRNSAFFALARVFAMLWHESDYSKHATNASDEQGPQYNPGRFNVPVYTTVRRMAIVSVAEGYSLCIPIVTYGGQGVTKPGIPDSEIPKHAAVHMNDQGPVILNEERARGMSKEPIAVTAAQPDQKLLPMSRLNYGKIYAVEHNVKVMNVGTIQGDERRKFLTAFFITHPR